MFPVWPKINAFFAQDQDLVGWNNLVARNPLTVQRARTLLVLGSKEEVRTSAFQGTMFNSKTFMKQKYLTKVEDSGTLH